MADTYFAAFIKVEGYAAGDLVGTKERQDPVRNLQTLLNAIQGGTVEGSVGFVEVDDSGTNPDGTIAVTAANVDAGDTVTIGFMGGDVVLTAGTDFTVDTSSNTIQAGYLKDAINEHRLLRTVVVATEATGTVTLTALFPGDLLENVDLATSDATAFGLTAIGSGTAGVDGVAQQFFAGADKR